MPYLLEDELKEGQEGSQNLNAPSTVLNSPGQAKTAQKSGAYTNLQTYLDANKPQAEAMGQKVSDTVSSAGEEAKSSVSQFESAKPGQVNKVTQDELNTQFYSDPTKADKSQYDKIKSGYSGPNSVEQVQGYDKAAQSTQKANEVVNQAQTFDGRQNILQNIYARPDYSKGAQRLDSALLGGNETVKNNAAQLKSKYADLGSYLDSAKNNVSNTIAGNIDAGHQNKQLINTAEQQAQDNFYNNLVQKSKDTNQQYKEQLGRYQGDLIDNALNPETLALAGLNEGQNIFDLNLSNYLSGDMNELTADQAAADDDRAKWAALQNLIGGNDVRISADGKKSLSPISFDKNRFNEDLSAAQQLAQQGASQHSYVGNFGNARNNEGDPLDFIDSGGTLNQGGAMTKNLGNLWDIYNSGLSVNDYVKNNATGASNYQQLIDQITNDMARYNLNKRISDTSKNAIKTPTGTVTGGLKG